MIRKRAFRLGAGLVAGALLAGPLQAADEPSVERLDRRVDRLENIVSGGQVAALIQRIDELERELRELRGEIETQAHRMDELRKRQRNLYADLDRRIRAVEVAGTRDPGTGSGGGDGADAGDTGAGTGGEAGGDPSAETGQQANGSQAGGDDASGDDAGGGGADPAAVRAAYDSAFNILKDGRYTDSAQAFASFVQQYPDSPYSDNAQYWLGESYYVSREFESALQAFRKVLDTYPESAKVPDAHLKLGYTLYELGRMDEARSALREVIEAHPDSAVSRLAEERLLKIKRETE